MAATRTWSRPSARDVLISDWSKALDPRIWLAVDYFDGHWVLIRMQGARSSTESIQREKLLFWAFFWYSNYPASVSWECLGKPGKIQLNDVSLRLNRDCRICRFSRCCLSLCLRLCSMELRSGQIGKQSRINEDEACLKVWNALFLLTFHRYSLSLRSHWFLGNWTAMFSAIN